MTYYGESFIILTIEVRSCFTLYNTVMFDLDNTIVDSSKLKPLRDRRDWFACYKLMNKETSLLIKIEVFLTLLQKGYKIGIVTNSPRKYAEVMLNLYQIPYDALVAYQDVTKRKPHPEPIQKCAQILKTQPQKCIYIGDDIMDVIAANRLGAYSIAVPFGIHNELDLMQAGAKKIFKTPLELNEKLKQLKGVNTCY
jgi:HAD superfamily hydrolase (TIGR01662 family)